MDKRHCIKIFLSLLLILLFTDIALALMAPPGRSSGSRGGRYKPSPPKPPNDGPNPGGRPSGSGSTHGGTSRSFLTAFGLFGFMSSASAPKNLYEPTSYFTLRPHESSHESSGELPAKQQRWNQLNRERIETTKVENTNTSDSIHSNENNLEPRILVFLPKERAYEEVFKEQYSAKAADEMNTAATKFGELLPGNVRILEETHKTLLLDEIRQSEGRPVVVVAHSVGTGPNQQIILSDGNTVPISEIHNAGIESKSLCIVVTCHGQDLNINRNISLTEAYNICHRGVNAFKQGKAKTAEEIAYFMRLEATAWKKSGITISVIATIAGELVICTINIDSDSPWKRYIFWIIGGFGALSVVSFGAHRILINQGIDIPLI